VALVVAAGAGDLHAQGYYNLDAGRPMRVEDATPTPRHEMELQLFPIRFERYGTGIQRWRSDSKISYGIAPFTDFELRVPILFIDHRIAGPARGVGGVAIGGTRALTIETGAIPALAVGAEYSAPLGNLSAPVGSYSASLLVTKTLPFARVHVNAAVGTWSIRPAVGAGGATCPSNPAPGTVVPAGCAPGPPTVPDTPCDRAAAAGAQFACLPGNSTGTMATRSSAAAADSQASTGPRLMAGIGIDHVFALSSTVIMADVVAEKFTNLYESVDILGEVGMRRQLTPQLVLDIGVGRHFALATRSTTVTLGFTYERAVNTRAGRAPAR
jgi:hypothetical protein